MENISKWLTKVGYSDDIGRDLDALDQELTRARLDIKVKCTKIRSHPWSPKLRNAKRLVTYWKIWLFELKLK